ncbi:MAG: hypothetical protein HY903_00210 [Deltaproteobacteria bacterium]|nr:hypothetical protein [Deltaproteobacteria bacterium]
MSDEESLQFDYHLAFDDGALVAIKVRLDGKTLARLDPMPGDAPEWTKLDAVGCPVCPLTPKTHPRCPVALCTAELVSRFSERYSYDLVRLQVVTAERTYVAATTLQAALGSLTGIYMVTAGCPVMDKLRPMVRFHLPLATEHETVFRAAAMYLVAQFMRSQDGDTPDWTLDGLDRIYRDVHQVNRTIAKRVRAAAAKDATANALVRLDLFTHGVSRSTHDRLADLRYLFVPTYVRERPDDDLDPVFDPKI